MSEPTGGRLPWTVLVVDDEPDMRETLGDQLVSLGFPARTVADGAAALSILREEGDPPHVLLVDLVLPGQSGLQLAAEAVATRPGLRILYISGIGDLMTRPPGGPRVLACG